MWKFYNPNPSASRVGDCAIRAVSKATGQTWEKTYIDLCSCGLCLFDLPSANSVWGKYLAENGFERKIVPNTCPDCYSVTHFAEDHPNGVYVVAVNGHVVTVCDGDYFDTWDSGDEVPLYYWERKGD